MSKRLTNEIIDKKLEGRYIRRINNFINSLTKIWLECTRTDVDHENWQTLTANLLRDKNPSGCPKCSSEKSLLTNEIIDERLIGRDIKRAENYINSKTKMWWECTKEGVDHKNWLAVPDSILRKKKPTGCPKCREKLSLTNEMVDEQLIGRNIKRAENYIDLTVKMWWGCTRKDINHKNWLAKPQSVLGKKPSGCPECSGNLPLTNEIIDERLKGRNIQRIDDYVNNHTKLWWKCTRKDINHKNWLAKPSDLLKKKNPTGCPECNGGIALTNEIIDERLKGRYIKRTEDYKNAHTKMWWECTREDVNHKNWYAIPDSVVGKFKSGCPECGKNSPLTNEIIDKRLEGRNIQRLEDYKNINIKMWWGCTRIDVNHKNWKTTACSVIGKQESGCPACNKHNKNEDSIAAILDEYAVNYSRNYNIKNIDPAATRNLTIDFYLHDFNIGQEYDGEQHKNPVCFGGMSMEKAESNFIDQQERDQYKDLICKDKITLIRIDGDKFKNKKLKEFVENFLETVLGLKKIIKE